MGPIIEKHLTLDRQGGGPDDCFSLGPQELRKLCLGAKTAWQDLGKIDYGRKSSEQTNLKFQRSLYFEKNLKPGDVITSNDIRSIRAGCSPAPKHPDAVIGKKMRHGR